MYGKEGLWLDGLHWVGIIAGALSLAVLLVGLLLAVQSGPRRRKRRARRALLRLHVYGGLAAVGLALAHHVGRGVQSGALDFTPLLGHAAGVMFVLLLVTGLLRHRRPRPLRRYHRAVARAHTLVWIAALALIASHAFDEYQVHLQERFAPPVLASRPAADQAPDHTLSLTLAPSLYLHGQVKAQALDRVRLLDRRGRELAVAAGTGPTASLSLRRAVRGDYFLEVNGLTEDLVPTRLARQDNGYSQLLSATLQMTAIGPKPAPAHLIRVFAPGQGSTAIVRYSDGGVQWPRRYAYIVASPGGDPQTIETRVLGTGALVDSMTFTSKTHDLRAWLIGNQNHGHEAGPACAKCHGDPEHKAPTFSAIRVAQGWCYRCHYGRGGPVAGIVDPAR